MVTRADRRRLASRERVIDAPNFRDHGMTVDRWLLDLVSRLQKKHGRAYASVAGLRAMIEQDAGHLPGVGTLEAALERLSAQGLIVNVWLVAGQIRPDGELSTHGTRIVYVPKLHQVERARKWNAEQRAKRREGYRTRLTGHEAGRVLARIGAHSSRPAPAERRASAVREYEARREDALRKARELAALWASEDAPDPPKGPE